jgi:hypothetical protein
MREMRVDPELKALVAEASCALARLDADRLEELALCCRALNRDLTSFSAEKRTVLAHQAREAARDMAVFARVLEATRANLNVMNRLRELHLGRQGYQEPPAGAGWECARTESGHGDN